MEPLRRTLTVAAILSMRTMPVSALSYEETIKKPNEMLECWLSASSYHSKQED